MNFIKILLTLNFISLSMAQDKVIDMGIAGIQFANLNSSKKVLGEDFVKNNTRSSTVKIYNQTKTEELSMKSARNGEKFVFYEFHWKLVNPEKVGNVKTLDIPSFKTTSGIQMGMSKQQIISIFGKSYRSLPSYGIKIVKYSLDQRSDSSILKSLGKKKYFSQYTIKADKLTEAHWGFKDR
jgi:hypothetical protein